MKILKSRYLFLTVHSEKSLKLTIICIVKLQKLKYYSFLMLATRTNTAENKIVLRYENSGDKLDLLSFFNSPVSLNL
jgi:hypothetical protein